MQPCSMLLHVQPSHTQRTAAQATLPRPASHGRRGWLAGCWLRPSSVRQPWLVAAGWLLAAPVIRASAMACGDGWLVAGCWLMTAVFCWCLQSGPVGRLAAGWQWPPVPAGCCQWLAAGWLLAGCLLGWGRPGRLAAVAGWLAGLSAERLNDCQSDWLAASWLLVVCLLPFCWLLAAGCGWLLAAG